TTTSTRTATLLRMVRVRTPVLDSCTMAPCSGSPSRRNEHSVRPRGFTLASIALVGADSELHPDVGDDDPPAAPGRRLGDMAGLQCRERDGRRRVERRG